MGKFSRDKGQRGERELYGLLFERLGDIVKKRDLSQPRDGGVDIQIADIWGVEVKRVETGYRAAWGAQAEKACLTLGLVPIVAHRRNRGAWTMYIGYTSSGYAVIVTLDEFCEMVREEL